MILAITWAILFIMAVILAYSMYEKHKFRWEAFTDVPADYFVPKTTPGGYDEEIHWSPGPAYNQLTEKLVESAALPAMKKRDALANWGEMTSERCYRTDIGEALKPTRNYLQRTNNYMRTHPDSCSAPNHEFVGTFYTPFDGVGNKPSCGTDFPKSTLCRPQ